MNSGLPRLVLVLSLLFVLSPSLRAQDQAKTPKKPSVKPTPAILKNLPAGLYAHIDTSEGGLVFRLHYKRARSTVYNFISLAEGRKAWLDPKTKKKVKRPFYNGLTIHRIVKDVLIQAGCPVGDGQGGPGYSFAQEFHAELRHDSPGVLSMIATREGSHGSQFFVTLAPAARLDGRFSVFGKLQRGKSLLMALSKHATDARGQPKPKVVIKTVSIHRVGEDAELWDPVDDALKAVPEAEGPIDPKRVWKPGQKLHRRVNVQVLILHYQGLKAASLVCPYTKKEAKEIAQKIVRLARQKGVTFNTLERLYSDTASNNQTLAIRQGSSHWAADLKQALSLKVGQVSEPLDTELGWVILYRPKAYMARHIFVSWKGGPCPKVQRSREQALARVNELAKKWRAGEDFVSLLRSYHDPLRERGLFRGRSLGSSAYFAAHEFPPVGKQASQLKLGEVSQPIETEQGWFLVQRIEPRSARHILLSWKGNKRVPGVQRSRKDAKALALSIVTQLKKGLKFEDFLDQSDDKVTPGGEYIDFAPEHMEKAFSKTVFSQKLGDISGVVETPYGFHIIQRTG